MQFPDHIFKSYDIRGLTNGELSEQLAYQLGRAFVRFIKEQDSDITKKSLIIGRDMRQSGDIFYPAVIKGITDEGINVIAIGNTTTPIFNFACANYDSHAGGIMVTASHNPAEYNGFKITLGNGMAVGKGSGMEKLRQYVEEVPKDYPGGGIVQEKDILPDYLERISKLVTIDPQKRKKIVIDAGNGMAYVSFPELVKRLPLDVEFLFIDPDGTFPNHEANPLKVETLKDLQQKVKDTNSDFGFALDADCDRIGIVDNNGEIVDASFVAGLIGFQVLQSHPKATMLVDLRSSMIVPEMWQQQGAVVHTSKVGHANIKPMMKEYDAAFASELSLHLYFKDMYNVESSELCLLHFINILQQTDRPLSEIILPLQKYAHSGEINFDVEEKDAVIENIEYTYKDQAKEISHLDGLKMIFDWGWVSIRKSNTEPVLRLTLEAKDPKIMKEKVQEFSNILLS